jgi:hypothetical protein
MLTSVAEVLEAGRGRSPAGVPEVSTTGEDARAGELIGLITGMPTLAREAGSSTA